MTVGKKSLTWYTPLLVRKDSRLHKYAVDQLHLSLHLGPNSFKVSCIDPHQRQCLLLATYQLNSSDVTQQIAVLEELYSHYTLLRRKEWARVTLSIGNQQYTLVPEHLFQADQATAYLQLACPVDKATVNYTLHPSLHLSVVFAVDTALLKWFRTVYRPESSKIIHQASSLIQGMWTYENLYKLQSVPRLFVHTEAHYLHVVAIKNGRLLYYNRFAYSNENEFLQYLLIVMCMLRLDTRIHEVVLGGEVTKDSLHYKKARRYIRHLTWAKRPPHLHWGWNFRQGVTMQHFDVLSAHLCH